MSKMIPEMGPVYQFAKFIPLLAAATGILAYNSYKEGSLEDVRAERPLGERLRHDEGVSGGGGKCPGCVVGQSGYVAQWTPLAFRRGRWGSSLPVGGYLTSLARATLMSLIGCLLWSTAEQKS